MILQKLAIFGYIFVVSVHANVETNKVENEVWEEPQINELLFGFRGNNDPNVEDMFKEDDSILSFEMDHDVRAKYNNDKQCKKFVDDCNVGIHDIKMRYSRCKQEYADCKASVNSPYNPHYLEKSLHKCLHKKLECETELDHTCIPSSACRQLGACQANLTLCQANNAAQTACLANRATCQEEIVTCNRLRTQCETDTNRCTVEVTRLRNLVRALCAAGLSRPLQKSQAGIYYYFSTDQLNWWNAEGVCTDQLMTLPILDTQAKLSAFLRLMQDNNLPVGLPVAIGLYRNAGVLKWMGGGAVTAVTFPGPPLTGPEGVNCGVTSRNTASLNNCFTQRFTYACQLPTICNQFLP